MRCPHCAVDINDPVPECPQCGFHIRHLDEVFGVPPEKTGSVVDIAGILTAEGKRRLVDRIAAFVKNTNSDLCVATTKSTAPRLPAEYVFWLFNRWQVGGPSHKGVLILLALDQRRIESEVGCALESIVTDEASTLILQHHAVPFFSGGKFELGLYHATDVLAQLIEKSGREGSRA
jgi:uncharacterized protein